MPQIAVLIATKNRSAELANRALKSVEAQTMRPDFLIVVDDSEPRYREDNRRIVTAAAVHGARVMYFENDRTGGASGAWNVGLDRLQRLNDDPSAVFVAILDDDDAWEPDYIEQCATLVAANRLDMIAADIVRHEVRGEKPAIVHAPDALDARTFLVRNPGIQGSNLFVRLSTILMAGMFDEALRSTTDRDLCIRIADLGGVAYVRLPRPLVHHHAESGLLRISTPGSQTKVEGLNGFWRKYRSRMLEDQRRAFIERSMRLFQWAPPVDEVPLGRPPLLTKNRETQLALLVGVIMSSTRTRDAERMLAGLIALRADPRLISLEVAVLENGPRGPESQRDLNELADRLRSQGVGCFVLTLEQQAADASAGRFGRAFVRGDGRVSIAVARTMLQLYLYELGRRRPGVVVWILDEDMLLESLTWQHDRGVACEPLSIVDSLGALSDAGVDVAIGTVTDAPPVPFASCVRTQLVDAYHNFEALAVLDPDDLVVERMHENMAQRAKCEDYYYDLSRRETDHLESPFWFTPSRSHRARDVFVEIVSRLPRILAGEQVFRPLILESGVDPVALGKPSVHRGGNAFVFDIEALREFTNAVPSIDGQSTRRSDMVWSLLNRYVGGRTVIKVPIAVRQDRSGESVAALDLDKLARDIHGFALYSALESLFLEMLQTRRGSGSATKLDLASLVEEDVRYAVRKFRKFLRERIAAFVLSFHRAAGLARVLERYAVSPDFWWSRDPQCQGALDGLRSFVGVLKREYAIERLRAFQARLHDVSDNVVAEYVAGLRHAVGPSSTEAGTPEWLEDQRIANARAVVSRERPASTLRHLGNGSEGVAFTDGSTVFKCVDYWKTRDPQAQVAFLRSLVGAWSGLGSLYPIERVTFANGRIVIAYPYEHSEPYRGGNAIGILALLRDLRSAGIVSTNMHPANLIVVGERVKLIDFGADIRRFTDDGFRKMARRAFLALKHSSSPHLKLLMRRSSESEALPELAGFDRFWSAIDPPRKEAMVDHRVVDLVSARSPAMVLDYGCGRGNIARSLAQRGAVVVAYDPDPKLEERWQLDTSGARYLGAGALAGLRDSKQKFDVVVSSLVLCTLNDHEARVVLDDLRLLMKPDGDLIIVVCNPDSVAAQTTLQERRLPPNWDPNRVFTYKKLIRSSGALRDEVHRPLSRYEELLRAADFECVSLEQSDGIDIETFGRASEFVLMRCRARKDGAN